MRQIRAQIEAVMAGKRGESLFARLLHGVSCLYGSGVRLRAALYEQGILKSHALPCKVISVGNITAGGTGKTPMTLYLAKLLTRRGHRVVIISRGYRGKAEKTGGIVSNGQALLMGPDEAGDEPFMMAAHLKTVPVVVGQNRYASGALAMREFRPDVILLDDAFQHLKLKRDLNLVLLDKDRPFGNGHVIPRGMLREPLSALKRADAFVLTRCDANSPDPVPGLAKLAGERPVFRSSHRPCIFKVVPEENSRCGKFSRDQDDILTGQRVFAFSGIAKNDEFVRTAESFRCQVAGSKRFPDHHPYSAHDIKAIIQAAKDANAHLLVTTEKDYARIGGKMKWPCDLVVIGIEMNLGEDEAGLTRLVKGCLGS